MTRHDAARLWTLNHLLLNRVMHGCADRLDALGLDTKEFFVLDEVDTSPYPAELAARLLLPKASVTVYVRNLVAQGYLTREIDEADLRRHRLVITPSGQDALDQALDALAESFQRLLDRLEVEERGELERLLRTLVEP